MSGTWTLTDNTWIASPIVVASGTKLTIDLNGYVLAPKNGNTKVIQVDGELVIKDSNPNLGHEGYIDGNGLFRWPFVSGQKSHVVGGGIIYNPYKDASTNRKGIEVNGTCTIEKGKIMGCYTPGIGAAMTASSGGTFIMTGGEISYNVAKGYDSHLSGVMYGEPAHDNKGSSINLSNVKVHNNKTEGYGGAICGYHVILNNCRFENNSTSLVGGAVYVRNGGTPVANGNAAQLNVTGCTFMNNSASHGGAIYTETNTPCTVKNSTVSYNNATSSGGGLNCNSGLTMENSTVSYNSAVNGGGIRVSGGNCTITTGTKIEHNYATTGGGGIYSSCTTLVKDSFITGNRAMSTETGLNSEGNGGAVNKGRGGGFFFSGDDKITDEANAVTFVLHNTEIKGNASMYYGGGGQLESKGKLTMQNNTKINENTCVLKGAAGLHLTGNVFFYMKPTTEISKNVALGGVGGGIHSSYECQIHLDGGTISDNIVYGRGGGVHINTGGDIVLNGTNITGNKAYDGINLIASTVTKGDDGKYTWSTPVGQSNNPTPGYGGGVLINSGSCTMNSGSLSGNHAETLGGGICLLMAESGQYAHQVRLANFTLNSGTVSNNTTDGNGAGIYLMENILQNLSDAEKSKYTYLVAGGDWTPKIILNGGTISGNNAVANGGGAYQEQKTEFVVSANKSTTLSGNTAGQSGGAVYIAKGNFKVNGTANVTGNSATNGDGGAIYLGVGTQSSPSVFTVGNNGKLYLGGNALANGNTAGGNGGAIYCAGDFIMNGQASASILNNTAKNGGALYAAGNVTLTGNTSISNNTASAAGGAVYVNNGAINASNATITAEGNKATDGGVFYVSPGSVTLGTAAMSNNTATSNGGAIALYNGTFSMGSNSTIRNNTATNFGGGLYVYNASGQSQKTISCTGGTFSGNTAKAGGAVCADGNIVLTLAATMEANSANIGGGIYMDNGVKMTFGDGLIRANTANAINTSYTTASGKDQTNVSGVGGGIFMANNSSLEFNSTAMGIYNNFATNGGADICSNGTGTSITLPAIGNMSLRGFDVPGNDLYWVYDYFTKDTDPKNEITTSDAMRYEDMLLVTDPNFQITKYILDKTRQYTFTNYVCLDLGYDLVFVDFTVTGLSSYDNAEIWMSYPKLNNPDNPNDTSTTDVVYRKVLFNGSQTKTVGLPSGDWKFKTSEWIVHYKRPTFSTVFNTVAENVPITLNRSNRLVTIVFEALQSESGSGSYVDRTKAKVYENYKINRMIP